MENTGADMPAKLDIDEQLLREALRLGEQRTKTAVVHQALREYVQRRKRRKILELFGTIDFDPTYDYKAERRKR